ncbi:MAG: hypothetical protein NT178_16970 [Proteobacteria bacterium]|nr:hypothetical protein [Pseudomonadota bacterium]
MSFQGINELILLVDYRNFFHMSVRYKGASVDIELVKRYFNSNGWNLIIRKYPEIDFRSENYNDRLILYSSSEDRDLFYKSYIEDVLLGLKIQGAILIPEFHFFRAHHNKVFMEILRDLSHLREIQNITSKGYGTYEDYANDLSQFPSELVLKPSAGCGSGGVRLLRDATSKKKYVKRLSQSLHLMDAIKNIVKFYVRQPYCRRSNNRRKFVVQNFISDLQNDYKILIYGDKFYVLYRRNRKNDFRASGSGLLEYRENLPDGILDFAERVFNSFVTPYLSLDVGFNGREYFLIEFQFLQFGNYTLEKSPFYFVKEGGRWNKIQEKSILEEEFVRSIIRYLSHLKCK